MADKIAAMQAEVLKQKALVMKSLGLDDLDHRIDNTLSDAAKAARRRKSAIAAVAPEDNGLRRRSLRVRGVGPDGSAAPLPYQLEDFPSKPKREAPSGNVPWHLTLDPSQPMDTAISIFDELRTGYSTVLSMDAPKPVPDPTELWSRCTTVEEPAGTKGVWTESLRQFSQNMSSTLGTVKPSPDKKKARDAKKLTSLDIRDVSHVMKVIPDRIYSIAFHPAKDRLIALCGGKEGRLGVWVPQMTSSAPPAKRRRAEPAAGPGDDADAGDDTESTTAVFWPHTAPINHFHIPMGAPHLIVTSSYDGTLRTLDLNTGISWHVFESEAARGISALDVQTVTEDAESPTGSALHLLAGSYEGEIHMVDVKSATTSCSFLAHDRKVSSICSLKSTSYFLSSGGDGVVKVWDIRKLPSKAALKKGGAVNAVDLLKSSQSISSAYFSPNARHVVATCNDNKLRIWDMLPDIGKLAAGKSPITSPDPTLNISHDNHTGRWISSFRTIFDPANDDTIIVGNMKRFLDIYSATQVDGLPLNQLSNELLTAIPTLNAVHPSTNFDVIVSGTASGRMHLWT